MKHRTTLKELAKILNVSISTVSKALNDAHDINPATKERIRKIAVEKNYVPNDLAQSLKARKTKTIGVIIPDVLSAFFAKSLHGIETAASQLGYKIIICISNESNAKEAESIKTLINGSVDGLILSLAKETQAKELYEHFVPAIEYNIPIVLFDRITDILICDKITINDAEIAEKATRNLIAEGKKNILFLTTISNTSVNVERQKGYLNAIKKAGLQSNSVHIDNYIDFEKQLLEVLSTQPVEGILAADEQSAIFSMKTAINNGYKIPEHISVIGFTNGILGESFLPSLSTVDQHAEEQGKLALETIVARIEKMIPPEPVNKVISTSIIHRGSTQERYSLSEI